MYDMAVLIPYGNPTPWRELALRTVTGWYRGVFPGARVVVGRGDRSPWCKARAVADALRQTDGESLLIVADADSLTPGLPQAVQAVRDGAAWAVPHLKVHRFGQQATERIHAGTEPGSLTGQLIHLDQAPYKGFEGGGVTVARREVYLDCPLDPAFEGWGQEDEAWALALRGRHGPPWRGRAPLYHLWHEKPVRQSRYAGSDASLRRLAVYREARSHGDWGAVLEEARNLAQSAVRVGRVAT